jgi:hypothetical protein
VWVPGLWWSSGRERREAASVRGKRDGERWIVAGYQAPNQSDSLKIRETGLKDHGLAGLFALKGFKLTTASHALETRKHARQIDPPPRAER